jgi:hypothetical protein
VHAGGVNELDDREARQRRSATRVLLFLGLACLLQLVPSPRVAPAHDACAQDFGRFAGVARVYCPAEVSVTSTRSPS